MECKREAGILKMGGQFCSGDLEGHKNGSSLVGRSQLIIFLEDTWRALSPLCVTFSFLYSLAESKGDCVADVWNLSGDFGGWHLGFRGPLMIGS